MIIQKEKTANGFFESTAEARTANPFKNRAADKTENFKETLNSVNNFVKYNSAANAANNQGKEIIVDAEAAKFAVEIENVNSSIVELNLTSAQDFGFDMKMNAVENIEEVLRAVSEVMNLDIDTNLPMVNFDVEEVPQEVIEQLAELLVIFKDISDAFLETGLKNEEIENRGDVYTPEQAIAIGQYLQQEILKLELSFAELGVTEEVAQEAMKISPKIEANTGLHFAADLETKTPAQQILPKTLENILGKENVKSDTGEIKNIVERLKEAMGSAQNSTESAEAENVGNATKVNKTVENAAKTPTIEALSGLKKEITKETKAEVKTEVKPEIKTEAKPTLENSETAPKANKINVETKEETAKTEIKDTIKNNENTAKVNVETKDTVKEAVKDETVKTEAVKETTKENVKETAKKTEVKSQVKTEVKTETKSEIKTEVKTETKSETKTDIKSEVKSEAKTEVVKETVKPSVENSETSAKAKTEAKENAEVKSEVKPSVEDAGTKVSAKKRQTSGEARIETKADGVLNNEFVSPIKDSIIRSTEANIASPIALDGVSIEAGKFNDASEIQSVSPRFIKLFEKEIVEQVQKTILSAANKNGSRQISLTLNPEKLGEVKLTIQVEGNVVSAKMNVENSQVKNIIEQNLQQLKEALGRQDLTAGSLDVNVGGNEARDLQERLHNARVRAQDKTGFNGEEGVMTDESSFEFGIDTGRRYGNNSFEFFA